MIAETSQAAGGTVRPVGVLAFTTSRHRPLMLRHCIMQMRRQTYPVDHAIYVNSDVATETEFTSLHYDMLIRDAGEDGSGRLRVGYGPSLSMHRNHLEALRLADLDAYELFLKIDDDDIYFRSYVEAVVEDFASHQWDYSGSHAQGWLNGRRWIDKTLVGLGQSQADRDRGMLHIMPPTSALSRRAIDLVLSTSDGPEMDDIVWRRAFAEVPDLVMAIRPDSNFVYNVHGANISTAASFKS